MASRGDYTQSSSYYGGTSRGNYGGSVYNKQYTGTNIPTGRMGGTNVPNPYVESPPPLGAGAVGQGANNQQFDRGAYDRQTADELANTGFLPDRPTSFADAWDNTVDWSINKFQSMPIVKIGNKIIDRTLIDDAGQWLGGWSDSPWNPMNWESGDPPQWTVELGDGTVLERGSAADGLDLGMLYGGTGGGSSLGSQASRGEVGDKLTTAGGGTVRLGGRNVKQEGDEGYIDYTPDADNPEDMDIPAGSFFNHRTQQIESIQGDPYAYRRIDASNAWKEAGINDLVVSDEEWSQMSEEERQENFEARKEAAKDTYNFGDQLNNPSPFTDILPAQNAQGTADEWIDSVREMYNNGEITSQQLNRALDDAKRNQGASTVEQLEVAERIDFLKDAGGFEDEELAGFVDEFAMEEFSFEGVRSKDDYFDTFQNTLQELTNVDPALEEAMYELYDSKRDADYTNSYNYLDSIRGTDEFGSAYANTDVTKRNAYLSYMHGNGELSDAEYKQSVAANLAADGEFVFQTPDGDYAVGTPDGIYGEHKLIVVPNAEGADDQPYFQYQKDRKYDDIESVEGASDEFNERRKRIARLDNTGGVFYDNKSPRKKPESSLWDKAKGAFKDIALNALTGGAYSAVPAIGNILKGEATTEDWAIFATPALEATGVIRPPSGKAGDVGRGLEIGELSLSYANTVLGVDALLADDLESFFVKRIATPYVESKLKEIDWQFPESIQEEADKWQAYWDTVPDDIKAGIDTTVLELYKGSSFEEAAAEGIVEWAEASGNRDRIEEALGDAASGFDDEFLQPFKDKVTKVVNVENAREFLSDFDDETLQKFTNPIGDLGSEIGNVTDPILSTVGDIGSATEDVIRDVGSEIGNVTDPILSTVGDVGSATEDIIKDVGSAVGDVTDPVFSAVGDVGSAIEDAARPIGSAIEDAAKPVGSAIDDYILQPTKTLLGIGAGLLLGGGGGLNVSGTRTTDSLFRDDLFKFKEKDFGMVERVEQAPPRLQVVENFYDDPFASDFNDRNL
jgi:hypothetical protein